MPPACFLCARMRVCRGRGNTVFHRCKARVFAPQPLLSRLFVPALITALRAATKTPLAFMRLMKVSADGSGAALPPCVRTHGSVRLQALPD